MRRTLDRLSLDAESSAARTSSSVSGTSSATGSICGCQSAEGCSEGRRFNWNMIDLSSHADTSRANQSRSSRKTGFRPCHDLSSDVLMSPVAALTPAVCNLSAMASNDIGSPCSSSTTTIR